MYHYKGMAVVIDLIERTRVCFKQSVANLIKPDLKIPHIMTLESKITRVNCL